VKEAASVGPIVENPIPSWASPSDSCSAVRSCDSCQSGASSYCHYTQLGQATCCERATQAVRPSTFLDRFLEAVSRQQPIGIASVSPISVNPIPSWASDSDTCATKRSCDACTNDQYCKYTFTGKPQCCEARKLQASA